MQEEFSCRLGRPELVWDAPNRVGLLCPEQNNPLPPRLGSEKGSSAQLRLFLAALCLCQVRPAELRWQRVPRKTQRVSGTG